MQAQLTPFDVAIIGSGIAGATLGAILARQGLQVILFEASSHPKFAIGESMILETSEVMRAMAELYDVPELAFFSSEHYFDQIGTSHGVKRHFSYLHHTESEPFDHQRTLQAVIPQQPHGHELHLYRQDTDYFLTTLAIRYGATVLQKTRIQSIQIDMDGVQLQTQTGQTFAAKYVVDAGGVRSLLAEMFDLRVYDLRTHSRAIFTHMVDVPCFHQVGEDRRTYGLPFRLSEGTLHHVFEGGWLWVIPFNNHSQSTNPLCSVGLMLDPRIHPSRPDLSPAAEFYQFIERFPDIATQFSKAKAVREWTHTGRIQYGAKQVVGDRFCLLGQAAGFIDPLFSKGLYTALMCTSVLADRLIAAKALGDYSKAQFQVVEEVTLAYIQANDRLVANAYNSFRNYQLWSPFSVLWLLGAYLELVKLTSSRALATDRRDYYHRLRDLRMVGGGFPDFSDLSQRIYGLLDSVEDDNALVDRVGQHIKTHLDQFPWLPETFRHILQGKNHLPANKLNLRLLRRQRGILGSGSYRTHFFDDRPLPYWVKFYLEDKAKYSEPKIKSDHAQQRQMIRPLRSWSRQWVQAAAIAVLIFSSWTLGYGTRAVKESLLPTVGGTEQLTSSQTSSVIGLVNFLEDPGGFAFACKNHTGQIVDAAVEGDRLTIIVERKTNTGLRRFTLHGTLDEQGLFDGTYQVQLPNGRTSGGIQLKFGPDGSAHGVNKDWGRAIEIQKI